MQSQQQSVRGHSLKSFVDSLIQSLPDKLISSQTADQFGLVYFGNVHDAIPRLLILDQSLRLEERCVWQVMRVSITDASKPASLLTQSSLALQCCVDIKTIRRYLHVLRATRWITRCAHVRHRGTVWALHDEPLSLADTLLLDPGYMNFVKSNSINSVKRLQQIAHAVLGMFESDASHEHNYCESRTQLDQIAARLDAHSGTRKHGNGSFFAAPQTFSSGENVDKGANFPIRNSGFFDREICPANVSTAFLTGKFAPSEPMEEEFSSSMDKFPCSSFINTNSNLNTTTTKIPTEIPREEPTEKFSKHGKSNWLEELKWPKRLTSKERELALPALALHDRENAQYLLNYLSDRLSAASRCEAPPVPNPLAYLVKIAGMHANKALMPSTYGVRDERKISAVPEPVKQTVPKPMSRIDAAEEMKKIRRTLGRRT